MNELQIQYFFAVADCGGYTQAAQDLFVSQPAISKQIAALEEELGVTLFERGKQTRLTESGRLFYDCFQRMLGELSSTTSLARQVEREAGHNQRQSIRLAFFIDWDVSFFMLPCAGGAAPDPPPAHRGAGEPQHPGDGRRSGQSQVRPVPVLPPSGDQGAGGEALLSAT